jgi:hypothetical protein
LIERYQEHHWICYVQWCSAVGIEIECDGHCLEGSPFPDDIEAAQPTPTGKEPLG